MSEGSCCYSLAVCLCKLPWLKRAHSALQWKAYDAWSAYGAEVPLAVPAEDASQVSLSAVYSIRINPYLTRDWQCCTYGVL